MDLTLDIADKLPHVYHGAVETPEAAKAIQGIVALAGRS